MRGRGVQRGGPTSGSLAGADVRDDPQDRQLELALDVAAEVVALVEELETERACDAESEPGDQRDEDRERRVLIVGLRRGSRAIDDADRIELVGAHLERELGLVALLHGVLKRHAMLLDLVLELSQIR